jgi:asparaginyl-tRNA synthetase
MKLIKFLSQTLKILTFYYSSESCDHQGEPFEETKIVWGMDLNSEHERYMCEKVFQRPTIVINYPKDIKVDSPSIYPSSYLSNLLT